MPSRQKIFVSYHRGVDELHRDAFLAAAGDWVVGWSAGDAAIVVERAEGTRQRLREDLLRDSTVTVVLIGAKTLQRRHVDWEIGCSLSNTRFGERSGLLGILLPSYPAQPDAPYHHNTLPPRLADNLSTEEQRQEEEPLGEPHRRHHPDVSKGGSKPGGPGHHHPEAERAGRRPAERYPVGASLAVRDGREEPVAHRPHHDHRPPDSGLHPRPLPGPHHARHGGRNGPSGDHRHHTRQGAPREGLHHRVVAERAARSRDHEVGEGGGRERGVEGPGEGEEHRRADALRVQERAQAPEGPPGPLHVHVRQRPEGGAGQREEHGNGGGIERHVVD